MHVLRPRITSTEKIVPPKDEMIVNHSHLPIATKVSKYELHKFSPSDPPSKSYGQLKQKKIAPHCNAPGSIFYANHLTKFTEQFRVKITKQITH